MTLLVATSSWAPPGLSRAEPAASIAAAPAAADAAGTARSTVPRLDPAQVDVAGRVVSTTKGRGGAVRLEIEGADGKRLPALLPSEEVLQRHGLDFGVGKTVVLRGSMFQGARPALVVSAVVVDGKPVAVRDAAGGPGPTVERAEKQKAGSTSAAGVAGRAR